LKKLSSINPRTPSSYQFNRRLNECLNTLEPETALVLGILPQIIRGITCQPSYQFARLSVD
jgi:hypothetical protein